MLAETPIPRPSAQPAAPPPRTESPIIEVQGLVAGYGERRILDGVSFVVQRGEVFVVLGTSGCGKTTLLRQLIGLEVPLAGQIHIAGADLVAAQGEDRRRILRRFGVMFQNGALFGSLTLIENVRLPLEEFSDLPDEAIEWIARMKLELVGLLGSEGRLPGELSGGMQKRAAIARAMALDPEILFLDEPSAGLDPVTSAGLDDLILELAKTLGVTFVVVTHELQSIFAISSRVIMLDRETKAIIATGTPAELRDHPPNAKVRQFFRREAEGEDHPRAAAAAAAAPPPNTPHPTP